MLDGEEREAFRRQYPTGRRLGDELKVANATSAGSHRRRTAIALRHSRDPRNDFSRLAPEPSPKRTSPSGVNETFRTAITYNMVFEVI
jgi:hypothetical protein